MKQLTIAFLLITNILTGQENEYTSRVIHKFNFQPNCIALNKDNTKMLIGGENEEVTLYNLETKKVIKKLEAHYQPVANVMFSNIYDGFYSVGDRSFKLWVNGEEKPKKVFIGSHTNITDWATTTDEELFVGGSHEKKFRIWRASELDNPTTISTSQTKSVISVAISQDKKTIAAGSLDSTIELWDIESQTKKIKILAHSQPVDCLNFIQDGKYLVSASHDGYAKLWDTKSGKNINTYSSQAQAINAISISPNEKFLLAGTWDGFICLFSIPTGDLLYKFQYHKAPVWDLAWNNTGDGFYSCDKMGELVKWTVSKNIFVDFYFNKEISDEMNNSKLFAPKRKEETKDSYKKRQEKALLLKRNLSDKYYQQVLEKLEWN